jgi:hypothetical protein
MAQVRYVPQERTSTRVIGIVIGIVIVIGRGNKDIGIILGTRRRNIRRRIKKTTPIFA